MFGSGGRGRATLGKEREPNVALPGTLAERGDCMVPLLAEEPPSTETFELFRLNKPMMRPTVPLDRVLSLIAPVRLRETTNKATKGIQCDVKV